MDKHELAKRLMPTFLEELHEHVCAINDNLLAMEKHPPAPQQGELLQSLFRSAHSLKGAARAVNVELLETACHHLEDILSAVRDQRWSLTPALYSLLFKTADAMEEVGMRLRDDGDLAGAPLFALLAELKQAARSAAEPGTDGPAEPTSADNGASSSSEPAKQAQPDASASFHDASPESAESPAESAPSAQSLAESSAAQRPAAEERPAAVASSGLSTSIRVAADKLDRLLAQSGELLVARRRVEQRSDDVTRLHDTVAGWRAEWRAVERLLRQTLSETDLPQQTAPLSGLPKRAAATLLQTGDRLRQLEKELDQLTTCVVADGRLLSQACHALDDEVYRVRMLPFAEACNGLQRTVRDVAQSTGKDVMLTIEGEDVEVDRSVLEGLRDPLLHLVRNAVDHGIETRQQRAAAGKLPPATITISAALRGGNVEVAVADDGRGFDLQRIRDKVRQRGLAEPASQRDLARMVFLPGFSTAAIVTDLSGRGVGLDVVRSKIEALHGTVDVAFTAGRGTRFTLTVPLTLTTIRCMLVETGGATYAVPTASVEKLVRIADNSIRTVGGRDALLLGGQPIPLSSLAATLGVQSGNRPARKQKMLAIVLTAGGQRVALLVDDVIAEQEVLVKNLGRRIRRVRHVSGATLLPSGHVALVLNVAKLLRSAIRSSDAPRAAQPTEGDHVARKRLLVVDDSVTTRTLIKSILETEGYDVTVAADGAQAWELLRNQTVDLVVSDVDMPRLNGFELAEKIRDSAHLASLPVVLVTARGSEQDQARGVQVGARAYLVKSSFDQRNLIDTLRELL